MTEPTAIALLRALSPGQKIWLPAAGKSLWPLVRSGDLLLIERCEQSALAQGDIAVMETPSALIAHIVVHLSPLSTTSIVGVHDPPRLPVLGRVRAVRVDGTVVPVPGPMRSLIRRLPSAARVLKRVGVLRRLVRWVRDE